MTADALLYRDLPFPLNAFMHVLTREEGGVRYLHYGLFRRGDESIAEAQELSTEMIIDRLPKPPRRILEIGIGLGTTLQALKSEGYEAEGITPDERQIAMARARFGDSGPPLYAAPLEAFQTTNRYDVLLFQESSQYIDSEALFERAKELARPNARVLVLDEFALKPVDRPDALHRLDLFLAAAEKRGFRCEEEIDLSREAAPTIDYFLERLPRHRSALISDLGISAEQLDSLIESGTAYRELYRSGAYGYRLLRFEA